jgi:hypothetical protein
MLGYCARLKGSLIGVDLGMKRLCAAAVVASAWAVPAWAEGNPLNLSGRIDLGYRYYFDDGQYAGQAEAGFHPFVGFQLNGSFGVGTGEVVFQFAGLNDDENDRSLFNIQKAYFTNSFENWDLVLGYNVEDWGVSNGRTIVNVMNAKNRTNQVGNSDLIGTPMANANLFTDVGTFSVYALGDSVRGNFGGRATRQRGPFYTDDGLVRYEDSNSPDFALRYTHGFSLGEGSLDVGVSAYQGTARESLRMPGCISADSAVSASACAQFNDDVLAGYNSGKTVAKAAADAGTDAFTAVTPYYQEIRQLGLTTVYAEGNTQLRFEGFLREASGERFVGAIVGGDHSFHNLMGGDGTLTLALEYHYDDRSGRQPVTVYDDDVFVGVNFIANDTNDSRFNLGVFYDLDQSSQIYTLSASRRIGERLRVGINANHVVSDSLTDPLSSVDGNSYIEFSLSAFF